MFFCEQIVVDIIFILFPILVYFLICAGKKDLCPKYKNFLLDFANISSLYLLIRFSYLNNGNVYLLFLINVPLIISFLYKRKLTSLLFSFIIVIYYCFYSCAMDLPFLLVEYGVYNILFSFLSFDVEKYYYIFILFKGIKLSVLVMYIFPNDPVYLAMIKTIVILSVFYLVIYYSIVLIKKADALINLNSVLNELEKEKKLKNSLFKITHEVKNPISVVLGYLSMMDYSNIDKVKKYNAIIEEEINRTISIMDDFNSYSKIVIKKEPIDIVYLIEDTIISVNSLLESKRIILNNNVMERELIINGDYIKLKQVLVNIIKNATEAVAINGVIEIGVTNRKTSIIIEIKDNGCGINKDSLERMGEMFYTTKENGTGLGVSLSKEIIERHGGKLTYRSVVDSGTTVLIYLNK